MFEQKVQGFAIATQRVNDEGEIYLEVCPELMSEREARERLAAMATNDHQCSVLVPVEVTVIDSQIYAAMVMFYEAKIAELQQLAERN